MKKLSSILIGIFCPLFYYLSLNIILYADYSEKYAAVQSAFKYIMLALPGVALAFLLIKKSLKDFFVSFGICFFTSLLTHRAYNFSSIDPIIHKALTGCDEFSPAAGLAFIYSFPVYIASCFIGTIIACAVTTYRQSLQQKLQ